MEPGDPRALGRGLRRLPHALQARGRDEGLRSLGAQPAAQRQPRLPGLPPVRGGGDPARVAAIQDRTHALLQRAAGAATDMLDAIGAAKKPGAPPSASRRRSRCSARRSGGSTSSPPRTRWVSTRPPRRPASSPSRSTSPARPSAWQSSTRPGASAAALIDDDDVVADHFGRQQAVFFLGHVLQQPGRQERELRRQRRQSRAPRVPHREATRASVFAACARPRARRRAAGPRANRRATTGSGPFLRTRGGSPSSTGYRRRRMRPRPAMAGCHRALTPRPLARVQERADLFMLPANAFQRRPGVHRRWGPTNRGESWRPPYAANSCLTQGSNGDATPPRRCRAARPGSGCANPAGQFSP